MPEDETVYDPQVLGVDPKTLLFLFGELPFITALYEQARQELDDDEALSIDGMKQLLWRQGQVYEEFGNRSRKITPLLLSQCLKYMRNLSTDGSQADARSVYDCYGRGEVLWEINIRFMWWKQQIVMIVKHLFGCNKFSWESIKLASRSNPSSHRESTSGTTGLLEKVRTSSTTRTWQSQEWLTRWNPMRQCSWPPEDEAIEKLSFAGLDRARSIMGADLVRSEKFSTSFKDGIDIRETLRHWYDATSTSK